VALWWDPCVGQFGWSDRWRRGVGQLDEQVWVGWLHGGHSIGIVGPWLVEHEVHLDHDNSAPPPSERAISHWLIVDAIRNRTWVGTRGLAHKIVRTQRLAPGLDD
jgi:hypothetical protein